MAGLLVTTRKNDCLSSRLVLRRGATANLSTTISVPVMALQKWATFPQACRQPSRKIAREFSSRRSDCSPEFRKGSSMISLVARSEHSTRPPLISDVIFRLDANVYTLFSFHRSGENFRGRSKEDVVGWRGREEEEKNTIVTSSYNEWGGEWSLVVERVGNCLVTGRR